VQVPTGGAVAQQLASEPPASVAAGDAIIEHLLTDDHGNLEPPAGGELVLSVPSPEALSRGVDELRRVIQHAGTGNQPLVLVVEAADELREEQLGAVVEAAAHSSRPVILRVIRGS
jgi:hypothetical protein